MGVTSKYLEDLSKFEYFLDLNKDTLKKEQKTAKNVTHLHNYLAMKGLLFDLIQELKLKHA